MDVDKISKVVYSFGDSSVPPPYHRSYDIVATNTTISIVVDSYGDIVSEAEFELSNQKFEELIGVIELAKMKNIAENDSDGCTGGTSDYLTLHSNEGIIFEGSIYNCGGDKYGNMSGDIGAIKDKLKSFIPNFSQLLE